MDRIKNWRESRSESGFSLIDVVVTVAIIVALSVGGFIAYSGLVANAKQGAVDYAASNVYKSAVVYENDSDGATTACSAVDEYNGSSEGIDVELIVPDATDPSNAEKSKTYYGVNKDGSPRTGPNGETSSYICA